MKISLGNFPLSATLFFLTVTVCFPQDLDQATIRGLVRDALGAAVPGAVVSVRDVRSGAVRTISADRYGAYKLIELKPGTLEVLGSAEGFATAKVAGIWAGAGETLQIDITLMPAGITEEVTVVAGSGDALIEITRTVAGTSLSADDVDSLPNPSGDVLDLVYLLAGTDEEPFSIDGLADDDRIGGGNERDRASEVIGAGSISLSGGAAYSTNITIDGMDNNDDREADARFQPPAGSVEEVQVVPNQYSAEYGRASGGRINIRTRSGGERIRVKFRSSFEDENLNANTYNNNRRGLGRLPFTRFDPAATVTGPVPAYSGRTRFLISYQLQKRLASSLIDTMVPVDAIPDYPLPAPTHPHMARVDDIPNPQTDTFPLVYIAPYIKTVPSNGTTRRIFGRIDHRFSAAHSVTFNYQLARSKDLRQYRETTRYLEETLQARVREGDAVQFSDDLVLGDSIFNQFRIQISDHRPGFAASGIDDPVVLLFISDDSRAGSDDQIRGTIVAGNSTANFANLRSERRTQVQDSASLVSGRHTMRFGADIQTIRSAINDLRDATGTFNFSRVYDLIASQPSRYRRVFGATSLQKNTYLGLFLQDDFQMRPGVTVSAGIRYERESILRDHNNLGPRLALAWSPGNDGRSVFRFGAGIFYNRVLLRTLDDYAIGRQETKFDSEALSGPSAEARCLNQTVPGPNALTDKCRFLAVLATWFPDAPDDTELRAILSGLGIAGGGFVTDTNFTRFIEHGIRIPESYQFNASFERDLGSGFVIDAGFTFNKASGLWRETNVNAFRPPSGFETLTDYLLSLGTVGIGSVMTRFEIGDPSDPTGVSHSGGVRVVNLASSNASEAAGAPIGIAFAALEATLQRPYDPGLGQVEMVGSIGRSVFEGISVSIRRRSSPLPGGGHASFRASYTLSRNRDDGFVDTSSAQSPGDFAGEFGPSSIDRRHRFRFYARIELPKALGGVTLSPILRLESPRPFNLGIGGSDRNLDDVSNDRPDFNGRLSGIVSRGPDDPYPQTLADYFSLAPIGTSGNLPRNAGRGPALFAFNTGVARRFRIGENLTVIPEATVTNVLNAKVFSFGSDFINLSESGSSEFRRGFLVPGRTLAQRKIRLGLRIEF